MDGSADADVFGAVDVHNALYCSCWAIKKERKQTVPQNKNFFGQLHETSCQGQYLGNFGTALVSASTPAAVCG